MLCRERAGFLHVTYQGRLKIGIPMQSWVGKGWIGGIWVLVEQEDRDPCTGREQQFLGKQRQAWGLTRRFLGRIRGLFCPFIL